MLRGTKVIPRSWGRGPLGSLGKLPTPRDIDAPNRFRIDAPNTRIDAPNIRIDAPNIFVWQKHDIFRNHRFPSILKNMVPIIYSAVGRVDRMVLANNLASFRL